MGKRKGWRLTAVLLIMMLFCAEILRPGIVWAANTEKAVIDAAEKEIADEVIEEEIDEEEMEEEEPDEEDPDGYEADDENLDSSGKNGVFEDADTDKEGYVLIGDADTLLALMHDDTAWTRASRYRLTADIDLESCEGQNPIGNSGKGRHFMGTFDGAGHTISGIKISGRSGYLALFGYIDGAVIRDLTIEGSITSRSEAGKTRESAVGGIVGAVLNSATITGCINRCTVAAQNDKYVGGIVGYVYAVTSRENQAVTVQNCSNQAEVTGYEEVGGVVGYTVTGREKSGEKEACPNVPILISGCKNSGKITAYAYVGGIAGYLKNAQMAEDQTKISECTNTGAVMSTVAGDGARANAGGIVGVLWICTVTDSTNSGSVSADGSRLGGIVGYMNSGTVRGCANRGTVMSENRSNIGGVVGCINAVSRTTGLYTTVSGCSNIGTVAGYENIGGVVGYAVTGNAKDLSIPNQTVKIAGCSNEGPVTAHAYVGGIVGFAKDERIADNLMEISGCTNTGEVAATAAEENERANAGGIAGVVWISAVTNCTNAGTVSAGKPRIGGVAGYMNGGRIKGCVNKASIIAEDVRQIGGVIGIIDAVSDTPGMYAFVEGCSNEGEVKGDQQVGGIVGYTATGKTSDAAFPNVPVRISGCSNTGPVTANSYVGGVAGYLRDEHSGENQTELTACSNEGTVLATTAGEKDNANVGGVVGVAWISNVTDCLNTGTVRSVYKGMRAGGIVGYGYTKGNETYRISNNLNMGNVETMAASRRGAVIGSAVKDGLTAENNYYYAGPRDSFGGILITGDDISDDDMFPGLFRDGSPWIYTIEGPQIRQTHVHTGEAVPIPNNARQHQTQCICDEYEGNKLQDHIWDSSGKKCSVCGYTRQ